MPRELNMQRKRLNTTAVEALQAEIGYTPAKEVEGHAAIAESAFTRTPRPKETHSCEISAGILATRAMHALHSLPEQCFTITMLSISVKEEEKYKRKTCLNNYFSEEIIQLPHRQR